jgi:hypothetical protein
MSNSMNTLKDVTQFFKVDTVHDAALARGWVAVSAGDEGMVLLNPENGATIRFMTNIPMDGSLLISENRIFFDTYLGEHDPATRELDLSPCPGMEKIGLARLEQPHYSFATKQCLHLLLGEGDLIRFFIAAKKWEIPSSPYGTYSHDDHRVLGIGASRQGAIVLSRYEGRAEHLLDSLPDDPGRPKARAAVLKDEKFGAKLTGPAVAVRWAYLLSHEKNCLLSQHLRNPEVLHETPVPEELAGAEEVFLDGDGIGRVWAATASGLYLLVGPGSPAHFAFPGDREQEPVRLISDERFALVTTRSGRLFQATP